MAYADAAASLAEYQCHKVVRAMQIAGIQYTPSGAQLLTTDVNPGPRSISVDLEYMVKHKPKVGGYYVAYEDGYESWSPAEVFEAGYARL